MLRLSAELLSILKLNFYLGRMLLSRREAFLREAIEVHRAYEQATDTLRRLAKENKACSPEWDEVVVHQQQLLEAWAALSLKYGDFDSEDYPG